MKNVLVIVTLSSCLMACSSLPFLKSRSEVEKSHSSDVIVDNDYGQQELETANVDVVDTEVAQAPVTEKPMDAQPEHEVGEAAQEEAHSYSSVQEMEMPAVDQSIASAAPVIEPTEVPLAQTTVKSTKVKQIQKKQHFATKLPEKKMSKKEKLALNKKAKAKGKVAKADSKKSALVCKKIAKNGKKLSKRELASCEKKAKAAKMAAKAKYKKVARK